jgi:hypothetical protein
MSALYAMRFAGVADTGSGAIYIGKGKIVGIDVGNLRYSGRYIEEGGRLNGTVELYAPTGGLLVTGVQVPAGSRWNVTFDWPANFSDGKPQPIMINGRPVQVVLEKIGDI